MNSIIVDLDSLPDELWKRVAEGDPTVIEDFRCDRNYVDFKKTIQIRLSAPKHLAGLKIFVTPLSLAALLGNELLINELLKLPKVTNALECLRFKYIAKNLLEAIFIRGDVDLFNKIYTRPEIADIFSSASKMSVMKDDMLIAYICQGGSIELFKRVLEIPSVRQLIEMDSSWILHKACESGVSELVDIILSIPATMKSFTYGSCLLDSAFSGGSLEIVKNMLKFPFMADDLQCRKLEIVRSTCDSGSVELLEWLFSKLTDIREIILEQQTEILGSVCSGGSIEMLEWLLGQLPAMRPTLDACAWPILARACSSKNFNMTQHILDLPINKLKLENFDRDLMYGICGDHGNIKLLEMVLKSPLWRERIKHHLLTSEHFLFAVHRSPGGIIFYRLLVEFPELLATVERCSEYLPYKNFYYAVMLQKLKDSYYLLKQHSPYASLHLPEEQVQNVYLTFIHSIKKGTLKDFHFFMSIPSIAEKISTDTKAFTIAFDRGFPGSWCSDSEEFKRERREMAKRLLHFPATLSYALLDKKYASLVSSFIVENESSQRSDLMRMYQIKTSELKIREQHEYITAIKCGF